MKVKKTIWIPIIGGLILGALSFLTTVADLTIQLSEDVILGPWEIFNTLSAAWFGPLGALITELGLDISGYIYLVKGAYPAPQDANFMIGNYFAHLVSLLLVAFGYKYVYQRMRMPRLLAGWFVIMVVYYLVGIILTVPLHNLAVPGLGATYASYLGPSIRLEFFLVTFVTSLILLAIPERYRRPQWYTQEKTTTNDLLDLEEKA